jgi:hypothetical protein
MQTLFGPALHQFWVWGRGSTCVNFQGQGGAFLFLVRHCQQMDSRVPCSKLSRQQAAHIKRISKHQAAKSKP